MSSIFSIFGVDWSMLIVQVFNFGLLLGVLWYFLYTPLLSLLDERQKKIEKGVKDAETAEKTLMQASDEGKSILTKATKDAEAAIQNGKKLAEKEALDIVAAAQKRHDALLKEAEQKAAEEKRKSLQQAEHEIAKLVVLGVEKAITKQ